MGQNEIHSFEGKITLANLMSQPKKDCGVRERLYFIKQFTVIKERPYLFYKKGKGILRLTPHPVKFPTCDREHKAFLPLESNCSQNLLSMVSKDHALPKLVAILGYVIHLILTLEL